VEGTNASKEPSVLVLTVVSRRQWSLVYGVLTFGVAQCGSSAGQTVSTRA